MTHNDPNNEINRLHSEVKKLIEVGNSNESIIKQLQKQGLEPYYIESIIKNVQDEQSDKKSFRNSITVGVLYIVVGLLLNILSLKIAEMTNSIFFYCFWGIIAFGFITIIRGFILYKR